jgi:hypothetical protein
MEATSEMLELEPVQVFRDALDGALVELSRKSQHSEDVLEAIGEQMTSRGLTVDDEILAPYSQEALDALVKVVSEDLASLGKRSELDH